MRVSKIPPARGDRHSQQNPMLSDIRPLLTDEIGQLCSSDQGGTGTPQRDIFGRLEDDLSFSQHPARVVLHDGTLAAPASGEKQADAKATIWLLDHPRPIVIGTIFKLPNGERLSAIGIERRSDGAGTLTKVFLT